MADSNFQAWLNHQLQEFGLDGDVMASYISSILDDDDIENKVECVRETLGGFTEERVDDLANKIVTKWTEDRSQCSESTGKGVSTSSHDGAVNMENVLKSAVSNIAAIRLNDEKTTTMMDEKERKQLCKLYGYESVEKNISSDDEGCIPDMDSDLQPNTNSVGMFEEERRKRQEQKAAHTARLERDKLNRNKEKQKVADRKEKEKKRTQKREKRR